MTTTPESTPQTGSTHAGPWTIYATDLHVGVPGAPRSLSDVALLTPLPSARSPQAMYMGVAHHGRDGVFALGAGVEVRRASRAGSAGVGCYPSRNDCSLILVPAGRSARLIYVSPTGRQRMLILRLDRISAHVSDSAAAVRAVVRHRSAIGFCDLELGDPLGFYDPVEGRLNTPSTRACRRRPTAVPFPGSLGAGSSVSG